MWLVLEIVEQLDRSALHARHPNSGAGRAAYDPDMLLALLIYAYCQGVRSSRQIEQGCVTDVAFRVLCAQDVPDHTTIARFRVDHQEVFAGLFTQVLQIAAAAGMARFGTVAIDGTKIPANASADANRHRDWLVGEVDALLRDATQLDATEDAEHAQDPSDDDDDDGDGDGDGQRMPASLRDRGGRAERLRAALGEITAREHAEHQAQQQRRVSAARRLERAQAGESVVGRIPRGPHRLAEAHAHLAREVARQQAKLDRRAALIAAGRRPKGRPPVPVEQHPHVLRARRAVDAALAEHDSPPTSERRPDRASAGRAHRKGEAVANRSDDQAALVPMMRAAAQTAEQLHQRTGNPQHVIGTVLADAGYASDANLAAPGPDRLIALAKARDQIKASRATPATGPAPADATPRQRMHHRLRTAEGARLYKRRGATVEPGIGNLKKILDRFSRRGLGAATSELHLAAIAFNLRKIHRAAVCC